MNTTTALVPRSPAELALAGPVGSFDAYVDTVSRIPVLSREDEQALAVRLPRDGDLDAARQLVLSHLRFVVHIARGYAGYGLPLGDLVQEGNVGLMKAVKRFDPAVGVRLVSFAVHWIRAEIHEYVLRNWRLVKVATTKAQRKLFFNLRKYKKNLGWLVGGGNRGGRPRPRRDERDVTEMERRLSSRDVSFDPDSGRRRRGRRRTRPPPTCRRPMRIRRWPSSARNGTTTSATASRTRMTQLDERSQAILRARWMDEPKATLHELADRLRRFRRAHPPDRGERDQEAAEARRLAEAASGGCSGTSCLAWKGRHALDRTVPDQSPEFG